MLPNEFKDAPRDRWEVDVAAASVNSTLPNAEEYSQNRERQHCVNWAVHYCLNILS